MRTKILAALLLGTLVITAVTSIGLSAADDSSSSLPPVALVTPLSSSSQARLDPANRTGGSGEDPLSRNFNWSTPLVGLPGRAGLDLGLSLTYNSLVWTRSGSEISFDDDFGFPAPGFRLGFPAIQPLYLNPETGRNAFLLIMPGGERVELRQVGTSSLYHAADSSYLLLDSTNMTLRTTDGTQLSYDWMGADYQCTEIKDRNGNFITISYTSFGRIDAIVDTLARTIEFNYDASNYLSSITQIWTVNGAAQTHTWASFVYTNKTIQTNFTGLTNVGPQNGSTVKVLTQVTLDDGSRFNFDYTSWGQVWKISNSAADGHLLNYRSYNLPLTSSTAQTDCPRFTQRRDWAENWNRSGTLGLTLLPAGAEQEVVTTYAVPVSSSWTLPDGTLQTGMRTQVTLANGTYDKVYFAGTAGTSSGWQRGLPSLVETYNSANVRQRQSVTTWTQDNTAISYELNPRILETNVYDPAGNRARTRIAYQSSSFANGTSCQLPQDVFEYQADAATVLRRSRITYNLATTYTNRRIIGLVSERTLYEVDPNTQAETLMSRVGFTYDAAGSILGTAAPVQHDNTSYSASFVAGRANLTSVKRYNVSNTTFVTSSSKYNTAGALVSSIDPLNHQVTIAYADSFSDGINNRNTHAYPTTVTDADGFSSSSQYNFDFGAVTRTQGPPPAGQTVGAIKTFAFDSVGRIQKAAIEFNGNADYSHVRFVYPTSQTRVDTYATIQSGQPEAHSFNISDGHGRVIATAKDHPGSVGGFSGQLTLYNNMGQVVKRSNPTETTAVGIPAQWPDAGDDALAGWLYTQQTYDWKGRPLVKTNPDLTTKQASYAGCGCAGGQVVTLTDEGTLVNGVTKKRQQRIYSDVVGRTWKTELLNWQGGSVYSTTVNTYNARDQVTLVRQFSGAAPSDPDDLSCPSGTCQQTTTTYDGHGRLRTRHVPEQDADAATTYDYFNDDTVQKVTDARGATASYSYNARHLVNGITYFAPSGTSATPNVSFAYDAAGNRTSMSDGMGSMSYQYDQLSRLISETRQFDDQLAPYLNGSFTLSYSYNLAGEVTSVTDPTGAAINYVYDKTGRLSTVTGAAFAGVSQYATGIKYRAFGALKSFNYGSSKVRTQTYTARQQLATFRVGTTLSADFQYHADGEIRYAKDNTDPVMDRAYNYDQVGRLAEGLSGSEARGLTAQDGIYRQSYQYDVWSNLTGRAVNRFWSGGEPFFLIYINNREQGAAYDADGRVLTDSNGRSHLYDAAGRQVQTSEQSQASSWGMGLAKGGTPQSTSNSDGTEGGNPVPNMPEGGYYTTTTLTIAESYDGDGRSLKRVETKVQSTPFYQPVTTQRVDYYLRSTVLGGKVLTELTSQGQKRKTNVYVGSEVAAEQILSGPNQWLVWKYQNPVTASSAEQTGSTVNKQEYDPFGLELGGSDPYLQSEQPDYASLSGGSFYRNGGNPFDGDSGCQWNGMPFPCSRLDYVLRTQHVVGWELGRNVDRSFLSGLRWVEDKGKPLDPADPEIDPNGVLRTNTDSDGLGHWELVAFFFQDPLAPQNLGRQVVPLENLQKGLENLLKGDCGVFVQKLIDKANSLFGGGRPHATSFWDAFSRIQDAGGYQLNDVPNGGTVSGELFVGELVNPSLPEGPQAGPGTVHITPFGPIGRPARPAEAALAQARYVWKAFHETLHLAKRGWYYDRELALAGHEVDGTTAPNYRKDDYLSWSGNFDTVLQRHCAYPFK